MSKMNKRMRSASYMQQYETMFQCPICQAAIQIKDLKSMVCKNQHTFDFTKQGYVNMTTHAIKTKYDKALFESRRKISEDHRFFYPVSELLAQKISQYMKDKNMTIVDMGCGEGSQLSDINDILTQVYHKQAVNIGVDLAKEGILTAAKYDDAPMWLVADLAYSPFSKQQFDVVLNILSPSNYEEFTRILKDDGFIMKVVPQHHYLQELRKAIFADTDKQTYSNKDTVERFKQSFELVEKVDICYTVTLQQDALQALIQMTPLGWTITEQQMHEFLHEGMREITVDLAILIGRKRFVV